VYNYKNCKLEYQQEEICYLGQETGVLDAEVHVVNEALIRLSETKQEPIIRVFIYIDNQSAMKTLCNNMENSEAARLKIEN
jgi:hypothetical protein